MESEFERPFEFEAGDDVEEEEFFENGDDLDYEEEQDGARDSAALRVVLLLC